MGGGGGAEGAGERGGGEGGGGLGGGTGGDEGGEGGEGGGGEGGGGGAPYATTVSCGDASTALRSAPTAAAPAMSFPIALAAVPTPDPPADETPCASHRPLLRIAVA